MNATTSEVRKEVRRVFGAGDVRPGPPVGSDAADYVKVKVRDWPDGALYRARPLLAVLGTFPDGHGGTEDGDAEICLKIEESGAFVAFDW